MSKKFESGAVAGLAGRRIDADGARTSQFPLAMVSPVKLALANLLRKEGVTLLICSAACGADLLALDAALEADIRCRIVLPYEQNRFRTTSVIDRPGDWGRLFDRIVSFVDSRGDLVVLSDDHDSNNAYERANQVIIQEVSAAANTRRLAILVWEGRPRLKDDATAQFHRLARKAGLLERVVPTIWT